MLSQVRFSGNVNGVQDGRGGEGGGGMGIRRGCRSFSSSSCFSDFPGAFAGPTSTVSASADSRTRSQLEVEGRGGGWTASFKPVHEPRSVLSCSSCSSCPNQLQGSPRTDSNRLSGTLCGSRERRTDLACLDRINRMDRMRERLARSGESGRTCC